MAWAMMARGDRYTSRACVQEITPNAARCEGWEGEQHVKLVALTTTIHRPRTLVFARPLVRLVVERVGAAPVPFNKCWRWAVLNSLPKMAVAREITKASAAKGAQRVSSCVDAGRKPSSTEVTNGDTFFGYLGRLEFRTTIFWGHASLEERMVGCLLSARCFAAL